VPTSFPVGQDATLAYTSIDEDEATGHNLGISSDGILPQLIQDWIAPFTVSVQPFPDPVPPLLLPITIPPSAPPSALELPPLEDPRVPLPPELLPELPPLLPGLPPEPLPPSLFEPPLDEDEVPPSVAPSPPPLELELEQATRAPTDAASTAILSTLLRISLTSSWFAGRNTHGAQRCKRKRRRAHTGRHAISPVASGRRNPLCPRGGLTLQSHPDAKPDRR
jgi:hypothetical protein